MKTVNRPTQTLHARHAVEVTDIPALSIDGCGACELYETLTRDAFKTEGARVGLWFGYQHGLHLVKDHGVRPWDPGVA